MTNTKLKKMILLKHYISYHWGLVHENGIRSSSKYSSQILGLTKLGQSDGQREKKKILLLNNPPLIPIFFSGGVRAMLLLQRKQDFEVPTPWFMVCCLRRSTSFTHFLSSDQYNQKDVYVTNHHAFLGVYWVFSCNRLR